jgi:N-acetylmuramoyl-L-alanine amidase
MAWLDFAVTRPISLSAGNFSKGGMERPLRGLVLHIQQGTENGTFNWFNTTLEDRQAANDRTGKGPAYRSSAHFGNPKSGKLEQFIDTNDTAFAQHGNQSWLSIENEGMPGDALTVNQINNVSRLMAYLVAVEGVQLKEANSTSDSGLGYHSMEAGCKHPGCPGSAIISQRPAILEKAREIFRSNAPPDAIPGWVLGCGAYTTPINIITTFARVARSFIPERGPAVLPPAPRQSSGIMALSL